MKVAKLNKNELKKIEKTNLKTAEKWLFMKFWESHSISLCNSKGQREGVKWSCKPKSQSFNSNWYYKCASGKGITCYKSVAYGPLKVQKSILAFCHIKQERRAACFLTGRGKSGVCARCASPGFADSFGYIDRGVFLDVWEQAVRSLWKVMCWKRSRH